MVKKLLNDENPALQLGCFRADSCDLSLGTSGHTTNRPTPRLEYILKSSFELDGGRYHSTHGGFYFMGWNEFGHYKTQFDIHTQETHSPELEKILLENGRGLASSQFMRKKLPLGVIWGAHARGQINFENDVSLSAGGRVGLDLIRTPYGVLSTLTLYGIDGYLMESIDLNAEIGLHYKSAAVYMGSNPNGSLLIYGPKDDSFIHKMNPSVRVEVKLK